MFAVCVTFEIAADQIATFLPLMHKNAQTSLTQEQGCHRFDVLTDPARPNDVFLYELYSNAAAFQTHLESAHFRVFDAQVAPMIVAKNVRTYSEVAV